jgi:indole-3-glycerol phosphate synthase
MGVLNDIVSKKKEDVAYAKTRQPLSQLKAILKDRPIARISFKEAIQKSTGKAIALIAELKKASPSEGLIREDFDPVQIATIYDNHHVNAMSVLTEKHFFMGELSYLDAVRAVTGKPLLRKDFMFDEYQIYESCYHGANCVLLIAAILERSAIEDYLALAKTFNMDCLTETHTLKELDKALCAGADIIGINNRNLNTLKVDIHHTLRMLPDIPRDKVVVSESGIQNRNDVELLQQAGVDAILVGSIIMKSPNMDKKIDDLLGL